MNPGLLQAPQKVRPSVEVCTIASVFLKKHCEFLIDLANTLYTKLLNRHCCYNWMPNVKTHIAISKKRTGKGYAKLHKWIDGQATFLDTATA